MIPIASDVSFHIMEFLPVPTQFDICKTTRARSKVRAAVAVRKIRRSIKANRIRMFKAALLNNYTDELQRSLLGLFLSSSQIEKLIDHILCRGDDDYIRDVWTMFMDERNFTPYPQEVKDTVVLGSFLGWSNKKVLRIAISKMDSMDLNSIRLCLGIY